jgi:hypothetical protein
MRRKKVLHKKQKISNRSRDGLQNSCGYLLQVSIVVWKIYWKLETECRPRAVLEAASLTSVA